VEIGYVEKDAAKMEADAERDACEFDSAYYQKLQEKA